MSGLSKILIGAIVVIVMALAFAGGFFYGQTHEPVTVTGLDVVEQAWDIILPISTMT